MEKQELVNAIAVLSGALDAITRTGDKQAAEFIVAKILELTKEL